MTHYRGGRDSRPGELDRCGAEVTSVDTRTMSLQYLDVLRAPGQAPPIKLVVPAEFTNLLRPFMDHTARSAE